jgi:hypothetical protein
MAEPSQDIAHRVVHMRGMAQRIWDRGQFFFYIRIPEPLYPEERGEKYEEPIAEALRAARLGKVSGGGQQLGEDKSIVYFAVDVELRQRGRGLGVLRAILARLGAPTGTVIEEFIPEVQEPPQVALGAEIDAPTDRPRD